MREKLARFMAGRNGADNLARFISLAVCVILVLALILGGDAASILWTLALLGMVYTYFRMFSRNLSKRRAENAAFLRARGGFAGYFRSLRERWSQRREYKFFRCPSCRTLLRVPRGKGKIKVVCCKCGNSFIKTT